MMVDLFLIQLLGVILAAAGLIALAVSAHLFGTPASPAEKRRASDEWNRRKDLYRLPITPEVILSTIFFLGGIGILIWSRFNLCAFLAYWFPPLPEQVKLILSCR
jgi:hypothetical protein